jgi:magnesium-protoporphyrin O-methyltransferase
LSDSRDTLAFVECCSANAACAEFFGERMARRALRHYRRKGLDGDARTMVEWASEGGVDGASVLEVGGGIGAVAASLLDRGAGRAVNLEVVPGWEPFALELAADRGIADRSEFRVGDLLLDPGAAEPADVVALQRVVCCNPEGVRLAGLAARLARRTLVLSYPRDVVWTRWGVAAANALERLRGQSFRAFVHPPPAILAAAVAEGLEIAHRERGAVWESAALRRA